MRNVLILLWLLTYYSLGAGSSIEAGGSINTDTVWDVDTVKVTSNLSVSGAVTLTIEPGVRIEFQGYYSFSVAGALQAVGTESDSIVFTIQDTTGFGNPGVTNGSWAGFRFSGSSMLSTLKYCIVEYAKTTSSYSSYGSAFSIIQTSNLNIENCTIRNNLADKNGGAVYLYKSAPVFRNNTVYNNISYTRGGAFYISESNNLQISNNIFFGNRALSGGAIYMYLGLEVKIDSNRFEGNYAGRLSSPTTDYDGGAIALNAFIVGGSAVITNNYFDSNISKHVGGGIFCGRDMTAVISGNILYNNSASSTGGAIGHGDSASLNISHNLITNNQANSGGGVYYWYNGRKLVMVNNVIANNLARNNIAVSGGNGGGGVSIQSIRPMAIDHNTIVHNRSEFMAGGILLGRGDATDITNNIVYGNRAPSGGNIVMIIDTTKGVPDFTYNCIEYGPDSLGYYVYPSVSYKSNYYGIYESNLSSDPHFQDPSAGVGLDYFGTSADWSLQPGSPCINSGDPAFDADSMNCTLDLAGNPRVYAGQTPVVDMGAFEYQGEPVNAIGDLSGHGHRMEFHLEQNYPNPFNAVTGIAYFLPEAGAVELNIYSLGGRRIKTLVTGLKPAGRHTTYWDASGYSSGLYLVEMKSGLERQIRKMILVK